MDATVKGARISVEDCLESCYSDGQGAPLLKHKPLTAERQAEFERDKAEIDRLLEAAKARGAARRRAARGFFSRLMR